MQRRDFIKNSSLAVSGMVLSNNLNIFGQNQTFVSQRPPLKDRKFVSSAVEAKIAEVKAAIKDKELAWMFENCYPNTLDTTVEIGEEKWKTGFVCDNGRYSRAVAEGFDGAGDAVFIAR